MSNSVWAEFKKFIIKAIVLIFHIILLAIYIIGTWALDKLSKFFSPGDSTFSSWLETYDQPVVLLTFLCIFVITMFGDYIPHKNTNDRFEWIVEPAKNVEPPKPEKLENEIKNTPIVNNKENDDIYQ